ncbi:bacterio-opsin activator [Paenibacillus sp. NPDC057886]|uniref:bacterio-opsin activator n=1 Tax=Paenibacillus sp. NPDC057886 TaxID=3346270 RepID=UPI0036C1352D
MYPLSVNQNDYAARIIGFAREKQDFASWLNLSKAESRVFSVSGIGGIGKTTLLTELAHVARTAGVRTIWMDGRISMQTPGAFLTHLEMSLEVEYGRVRGADVPQLAHVLEELTGQRTVLLMDNCENPERIESWLLSSFLPRLAGAQCLFVFASRIGLPVTWQANPIWGHRIDSFPLELFSRKEVFDYVQASGLPVSVQRELEYRTSGHPLLLALTVDMLRRQDGEPRLSQLPGILSAEFLKEAALPWMVEALQVLSLLPSADQTILNQLLEKPLTASEYMDLGRLSCVRREVDGLSLHQLVSCILREDYEKRDPGQYQSMRSRILELLAEKYPEASKLRQMQIATHVLELYREQLPAVHAYADFSGMRQQHYEQQASLNSDELPLLHRYLESSLARSDWQSELVESGQHHALLDDIARVAPEGLRLIRNNDGVPLAFCAGLSLNERTWPLLKRYASELAELLSKGVDVDNTGYDARRDGDTVCVLLAAVDVEQPYYRPEELGAMLFQNWLVDTANGLRAIIPAADPQLGTLLSQLGFEREGHIPDERVPSRRSGGEQITLWELDFRQITFEIWVKRLLKQSMHDSGRVEAGALRAVPWSEMKQMVRHMYDDSVLEAIPSLQAAGCRPTSARELILRLLTEEKPRYPLTELEQRILRESYLQKNLRQSQLIEAFHMSRATFYRHIRQGFQHMGYAFTQAWTDSKE